MAIVIGSSPTTNTITVNTSSLATMLERANNAVKSGLIESWTPDTAGAGIKIVCPPSSAQCVAEHGGATAFATYLTTYFSQWGHSVV